MAFISVANYLYTKIKKISSNIGNITICESEKWVLSTFLNIFTGIKQSKVGNTEIIPVNTRFISLLIE